MTKELGALGVVVDTLPGDKDAVLEKLLILESVDFSSYIDSSMLENRSLPATSRLLALQETKRFLSLPIIFLQPDYSFVPASIVDEIWHGFIIDTLLYTDTCNSLYGAYLHHNPRPSREQGIAEAAGAPYRYTKDRIGEAFGGLTTQIWGPIGASCDTDPVECVIH